MSMENLTRLVYLGEFNQTCLIPGKLNEEINEENAKKGFERYVDKARDFVDINNAGIGVELGVCWSNLHAVNHSHGLFLMVFPIHKDRKIIFTPKTIKYSQHPWLKAFYRSRDPIEIWETSEYTNRKGRGAVLFVQNPFLNPERYAVGKHTKEDILDKLLQDRIPKRYWFRRKKVSSDF